MTMYYKKMATTDPRFKGKTQTIQSWDWPHSPWDGDPPAYQSQISVPDEVVLCNGCNTNLWPGECYAVYLDRQHLEQRQMYDVYCGGCVTKYFPKAREVDTFDF